MDDHFRTAPFAANMPVLLALVGLWHNRRRSSASVKRIAQKHHDDLAQRIEALQAMQRSLHTLLCHCPGDERPDCPILDDLGHEPDPGIDLYKPATPAAPRRHSPGSQ